MAFAAPLEEVVFALAQAASSAGLVRDEFTDGSAAAVLAEAAKFAQEKLAPLNATGDRAGARLIDGDVVTPPGWREAYELWRAGGWAGLAAPAQFGGAGLSRLLLAGCLDIWNGANMAFMLAPLLSAAAIDALAAHGSAQLQKLFLERIVAGEWAATMCLTEPQAGSDLSELRTRAVPDGEGGFRIFGQKIFITYGEHDLTKNIVHLVLARLPDAPPGTRGISLFLAPKFLLDSEGEIGARNDLRCAGLERKLGIHGSPTCTMIFGEREGAKGFLVGEANRGLACMFTMMNNARLAVGLQGVGMCELATQTAFAYARQRKQGHAPGGSGGSQDAIVLHPDVRRMLMTMKASTAAARAICYLTAAVSDVSQIDSPDREAEAERAALLTPLAKAFATDLANEAASLCVQTHGGMGYVEETGVAQLMRDARISAIYEGTNGIQALDLAQRKAPMRGGAVVRREIEAMRASLARLDGCDPALFGATRSRLLEAVDSFARATDWLLARSQSNETARALAGAAPYLRLFGLARGGTCLAEQAAPSEGQADAAGRRRIALARFFAENIAVAAGGLEAAVTGGAESTLETDCVLS